MAIEHAKAFVNNFFEDGEFTKEVLKRRGFSRNNRGGSEEEENEKIVQVANQMGFKFDVEEYKEANKEYLNEIGGYETMKKLFHIIKTAARMAEE